jgi:hypothetical protein
MKNKAMNDLIEHILEKINYRDCEGRSVVVTDGVSSYSFDGEQIITFDGKVVKVERGFDYVPGITPDVTSEINTLILEAARALNGSKGVEVVRWIRSFWYSPDCIGYRLGARVLGPSEFLGPYPLIFNAKSLKINVPKEFFESFLRSDLVNLDKVYKAMLLEQLRIVDIPDAFKAQIATKAADLEINFGQRRIIWTNESVSR